jgi:hypothetical protein
MCGAMTLLAVVTVAAMPASSGMSLAHWGAFVAEIAPGGLPRDA